jgi:glucosamine--fructose-6-phosphate aminotransferase (isomerizing)
MCGIIGVICKNSNAGEIAYEGLKRLDYRGYDSWGLAVKNDRMLIYKRTGKITALPKKMFYGSCAIGHTRWATHGKISIRNAHPHVSQNEKIAVVHNGIIENFQELREFLAKKGFSFSTETDTEVIPMLIELYLRKDLCFREAVRKALLHLKGSYAIVAMSELHDSLIGARKGSPLVAGFANGNFLLASDMQAIAPYATKAMFLEDSELIEINREMKVYDIETGKQIKKPIKKIDLKLHSADKRGFEHYMLKEIYEQEQAIRNASLQSPALIERVTKLIKQAERVFIIGCGTSMHAAMLGSYFFASVASIQASTILASEFQNFLNLVNKRTVVIALSQSGETADVLEAVKSARQKGAKIISIVNVVGSSLTRASDATIMMNAGPEICVLATKSYLAQLSVLYLLANSLIKRREQAKKELSEAARLVPAIIKANESKAKKLAERLKNAKSIFVIGKRENAITALEAALKIKEVSYIHAEGFPSAELKHGTIALIEKNVPVIAFASDAGDESITNAIEAKSRGAFIIGVSSERAKCFNYFFAVPKSKLFPILSIIPIQLLAYYLALARNLDPDKPRNLAKSVTVK